MRSLQAEKERGEGEWRRSRRKIPCRPLLVPAGSSLFFCLSHLFLILSYLISFSFQRLPSSSHQPNFQHVTLCKQWDPGLIMKNLHMKHHHAPAACCFILEKERQFSADIALTFHYRLWALPSTLFEANGAGKRLQGEREGGGDG